MSSQVFLTFCLTELVPNDRDVRGVIAAYCYFIAREIAVATLVDKIPESIVRFKLFRRLTGQSMFVLAEAIEDGKRRRKIHEYCAANGFHARTKYRREGVEKQLRLWCDNCQRLLYDVERDGNGEPVAFCDECHKVTHARFKDSDWDGARNTTHRTRYCSTGTMLIVDTRARPTPHYKKFALAEKRELAQTLSGWHVIE